MAPICLLAPTPAFWCPQSSFLQAHLPSWCPICLLVLTPAFWRSHLPFASFIFLKRPMTKCPASKRGPGVQFPGCNLWMTSLSCATNNPFYQLLLHSCSIFPRVGMCLNPSHHFVWAHKRDCSSSLLDLPCRICFGNVPKKLNVWLGKHTKRLCPLACLV